MNTPATIAGVPLMAVTTTLTDFVNRPPTSLMKTAVSTAAGIPITAAIATSSIVPTNACATPPIVFPDVPV